MAEELTAALIDRAQRGSPRGAAPVLEEARRRAAREDFPRRRWSGPVVATAAAAVALLVGGGTLLAARAVSSDRAADSSPVATSFGPATTVPVASPPAGPDARPFSWLAEDDLGLWVTEAEMTSLLSDLASAYAGAPLDGEAVVIESSDGGVLWSTGRGKDDPGAWSVWAIPAGGPYDRPDEADASPPQGHPLLPAGVGFRSGWGTYGFFNAPGSDEPLLVVLYAPAGVFDGPARMRAYEWASIRVGAMLLREMGWAG